MRLRSLLLILTSVLAVRFVHAQTAAAQPQSVNDEVMKSETISVDYDAPNAIVTAFEANNFHSGTSARSLAAMAILLVGKGKVDRQVFEWHPSRRVHNREIWPEIEAQPGYKFADVLTALKYALKLPDRQLQYPLVILFDHRGQCYCLFLDRLGGRRLADVYRATLNLPYRKSCRFLLIRQ